MTEPYGYGDTDGVANGIIKDPGGIAELQKIIVQGIAHEIDGGASERQESGALHRGRGVRHGRQEGCSSHAAGGEPQTQAPYTGRGQRCLGLP